MKGPCTLGKGAVAAGGSVTCEVKWVDSTVQIFENLSDFLRPGSTVAQREMSKSPLPVMGLSVSPLSCPFLHWLSRSEQVQTQ